MPRTPRKVTDLQALTRGKRVGSGVRVRGFYRVNIVEHQEDGTPRIVGDSGWYENRVVTAGMQQYLAFALISSAGSKFVSRAVLGTGGVPATNDTTLPGAFGDSTNTNANRPPSGAATTTLGGGGTALSVQFAFTWASTASFNTNATRTIANIALIDNTTSGGTIFAGNTYTGSQLNTNQDVQASYVIGFTTV